MSNPAAEVSIVLSAAAKRPKLEEVVNAPKIFLPKWGIIFTVASAFAVFIDPLSCYVPVIIDDSTCYHWDQTLMWIFFALRSAGDLFYGMDIFVFIKRRRGNVNAKPFGASWTKFFGGPDSKICKVLNGQKSLGFLGILPRICAALPILQAIILTGKYTYFGNIYSYLFYLIPIQYTLRAYNLYRWLDRHANIETAVKRFLKSALDFLPFILAAHLKRSSTEDIAMFLVGSAKSEGSKKVSDQLQLQQKIETMYPDDITVQLRNMWGLGLASLKKVPLLESIDEKVLKAICQYLKPVIYGEDVYIIREGEPLRKMFFITRGTALTYTTIKGGTHVCKCLEKSDFYGEELLNWAFKSCIFSELPIATTTLISQTKVEAFSISANHLKSIVAQFWLDFRKGLPRSQLEHFAASYIQAFWRRRLAKAKGPTGWDKLILN
ncbi:hypothetical protein ACE6H2_007715 [Prunus campanulata]